MSNRQVLTGFSFNASKIQGVGEITRVEWHQFFDTRDGLVHDCIETSPTNSMYVARCSRNDPMHKPAFVELAVTCMSCLAERHGGMGIDFATQESIGMTLVNARAVHKLQMQFVQTQQGIAAMHELINAMMPAKKEEPAK